MFCICSVLLLLYSFFTRSALLGRCRSKLPGSSRKGSHFPIWMLAHGQPSSSCKSVGARVWRTTLELHQCPGYVTIPHCFCVCVLSMCLSMLLFIDFQRVLSPLYPFDVRFVSHNTNGSTTLTRYERVWMRIHVYILCGFIRIYIYIYIVWRPRPCRRPHCW